MTQALLPTSLRIGCKINLTLRITGVRSDGWHELDSLFVPLPNPHDQLDLQADARSGIHVDCDTSGIDPLQNTLTKAYRAYATATGFAPQLHIYLRKGIPHGAGLGGGSADAAVLLQWLNTSAPEPLPADRLSVLAAGIGADVPFFLRKGPCHAGGIGDRLQPCRTGLPNLFLTMVIPPVEVSTPWAYRAFDQTKRKQDYSPLPLTDPVTVDINGSATGSEQVLTRIHTLINDFEPVVFAAYPVVRFCKERLYALGAQAAVMSGSGACVVGLFKQQKSAEAAGMYFQQLQGFRVFVQHLPQEIPAAHPAA